MGSVIIETKKLCKSFSTGGNQQHVIKNLDISVLEGDFTVIMGASGSGKSTLLYSLSGMDSPSLGDVLYGQENIAGLKPDQLSVFRRRNCGFVFQQIYLLDSMSIFDNILAGGLLNCKDNRKVAERAKHLLKEVGLSEEVWRKFPAQISGGEAQRAGIVRALINDPKVLFADEPTGALNKASGSSVLELLTKINKEGKSIVMVTHDTRSAIRGSRILYLQDGVIHGECLLGKYESGTAGRQEKLNAFLTEMGW